MPLFVIATKEQYEAALEMIAEFHDAPAGSKEAYLRDALQAAVDEWWQAHSRQRH